MSLPKLRDFDVVFLKSLNAQYMDRTTGKVELRMTWQAPKGEMFAVLLLGCVRPADVAKLDVDALLRSQGWTLQEKP